MLVKKGSNFSDNLVPNLMMIFLGIGLTIYGIYFGILFDSNSTDSEIIEAELIE